MSPSAPSTTAVLLHLALLAPASTNDLFLDRAFLPADAADLQRSAGRPSVSSSAGDEPVGPTCLADMISGEVFHGDTFSDPSRTPEWYDAAKVARGNAVFNKRSLPITLSWTLSLVVGLSYDVMLDVLVFTNASDTVAKVIDRYARTGAFLGNWCQGDPMNPNSLAFRSVQTVRNYHESIRKEIEPVLAPVSGEKEWMTQYDMGVVQTAFLSAFAPTQTFGFTFTDEEQDDFIYLWRVIGYQLGIDDRFNAATLGRSAMQKIIDDVFRQIILPALTDPPAEYGKMAGAFVDAMNLACLGLPCFTVPSVVGLSIVGYGEPMPAALSKADQVRATFMITAIRAFAKMPSFFEPLVGSLIMRLLEHNGWPVIPNSQGSPLRHAASACPALARRAADLHTAHNQACASLPAGHPADPEWCHTSPPTDDGAQGLEGGLPVKFKLLLMAPAATALAMTTATIGVLAFKASRLLA